MEMFFYFDPEFDASVSATFNVGTSNPSKYWYLDEFTNGLPNCNGLIGPGNLANGNVSFAGLTNPTPPPAIQQPNGQYVVKFTVIGAVNPISQDPYCATPTPTTTPSPSPSTSPTTHPTSTPTPTPTATGTPAGYSSIYILPSMGTINPGTSEGFVISQTVNNAQYTGPYSINAEACTGYVSVSAVIANVFTISAGSQSIMCAMDITGGGGQIGILPVDVR
jgi:hypothetical protein